jgi:hypothetical protein
MNADREELQRRRAWLLRVENLALVRRCRGLIRDEFGVTLRLNAPDLLEQVQRYASLSRRSELRQVAAPLTREMVRSSFERDEGADLAHIPLVRGSRPLRAGWGRPRL